MTESNKNTINFQIEGIELLEYAVNSPSTILPENIQYRFDLSIEHKINTESKKVFVITAFKILNDELKLNFGQARVSCIYAFPDVESFLNKENNNVELPQHLIEILNSISLSTSRGVMFTLFRGTFLHNVILPIIDPKNFTKAEKI